MFDPDYEIYLEIVEAGSISAAARGRGVSVASLSKRLARIEARLGVRLVHRTTRRLTLTTAGRDMLDTLLPLSAALRAAEDRITGRNAQVAGPLRITAPTSFGRMHVVPHLPDFLAHYPGIDLTIDLSDEFVDLLDGGYDIGIRIGASIGAGLVGHRLATSDRVLCAAPSYLARFGTPERIEELARHHVLATERQLPWHLEGPEGPVTHHAISHIRSNSSEVVRELALGGCGIALRSLWDVGDLLAGGALQLVLPAYRGSQDVGIFAVHAAGPTVPARVMAMVDHLQERLGDIHLD